MMKTHEGKLSAQNQKFAIAISRFNSLITGKLLEGALDCLKRHGAAEDAIEVAWVPGSFELPLMAQKLAGTRRFDAVISFGHRSNLRALWGSRSSLHTSRGVMPPSPPSCLDGDIDENHDCCD